jgi:hypothetical protein
VITCLTFVPQFVLDLGTVTQLVIGCVGILLVNKQKYSQDYLDINNITPRAKDLGSWSLIYCTLKNHITSKSNLSLKDIQENGKKAHTTQLRSMAEEIEHCMDLVTYYLDQEYPGTGPDSFALVEVVPGKVVQSEFMALYAQSLSGRQLVNTKNPRIRRELYELATFGPGHHVIINEIRYQFVKRGLTLSLRRFRF